MKRRLRQCAFSLLIAVGVIAPLHAQSPADPLSIKVIAEVEQAGNEGGREAAKLVSADRVVSGDALIYTLEIRNTSAVSVRRPTVTYAIPAHMIYVADSAVGPGTEVSYSIDSGHSFDAPENLKIREPGGEARLATAVNYTHIRWQLKNPLKANSVAFVRFRVRVK